MRLWWAVLLVACSRTLVPSAQMPYLATMYPGVLSPADGVRVARLYDEVGRCVGRKEVPFGALRFIVIRADSIPRWVLGYEAPTAVQGASAGSLVFLVEKAWPCDSCIRHELTHSAAASEHTGNHPEKYFNAACRNVW